MIFWISRNPWLRLLNLPEIWAHGAWKMFFRATLNNLSIRVWIVSCLLKEHSKVIEIMRVARVGPMLRQHNSHQLRKEAARNRKATKTQVLEEVLHRNQIVTQHRKAIPKDQNISTCFTSGTVSMPNKQSKLKLSLRATFLTSIFTRPRIPG